MQKKNLLVICAAAGLCIASVIVLLGVMGIYAEKSGTMEQMPKKTESEPTDLLAQALLEDEQKEEQKEQERIPEEKLQKIWEEMFAKYLKRDTTNDDARRVFIEKFKKDAEDVSEKNSEIYKGTYLESAPEMALSAGEAGLIVLKEICRLYPNDTLEDLDIDNLQVDSDVGINGEHYVEWVGYLENGYETHEADYVSYDFHVDAVSGKITGFGKFHPYQKDVDYSAISWTDEEITARAKELIETYDLAEGEELDWSDMEFYNGTDEISTLPLEFEEEADTSVAVSNILIFRENGERKFYLGIDWETGEIADYTWLGRWAI